MSATSGAPRPSADNHPSDEENRHAGAKDARTRSQRSGREDRHQQEPHPEQLEEPAEVIERSRHRYSRSCGSRRRVAIAVAAGVALLVGILVARGGADGLPVDLSGDAMMWIVGGLLVFIGLIRATRR